MIAQFLYSQMLFLCSFFMSSFSLRYLGFTRGFAVFRSLSLSLCFCFVMRASRGLLVRAGLRRCASTQWGEWKRTCGTNPWCSAELDSHQWGVQTSTVTHCPHWPRRKEKKKKKKKKEKEKSDTHAPSLGRSGTWRPACTLPRLCTMWPFLRGIQIFRSGFCVSSSLSNMVGPDQNRPPDETRSRETRALTGSAGRPAADWRGGGDAETTYQLTNSSFSLP